MILSVSRRTDIPAFYSDWFFDRLKKGYFLVPNPFIDNKKVAKVAVSPVKVETNILGGRDISGNIDGIIFWTKNPKPMLERLDEIADYKYIFMYTLNSYGEDFETQVAPIEERIEIFKQLASKIGKDRMYWRYDPIFFTEELDFDWHTSQFDKIACSLQGSTTSCKISFLIGKHSKMFVPDLSVRWHLVREFVAIAKKYGITIESCAVPDELGIKKSSCLDPIWWENLLCAKRKSKTLDNQRKGCLCMPCVDIGIYNTCTHGCIYCYANGFYGFRGEPKTLEDEIVGDIYDRKIERFFNY